MKSVTDCGGLNSAGHSFVISLFDGHLRSVADGSVILSARSAVTRFFAALILVGVSSLAGECWAQPAISADPAGFTVPPLPDPSVGQSNLIVGGAEAQSFRSIIPDPLYPLIRGGDVALSVAAYAPWSTTLEAGEWHQAPEVECLEGLGLAAQAPWSATRFPCGSRLTIERLEQGSSKEQVNSTRADDQGRRYLLNAERAVAMAALTRTEWLVQSTGVSMTEATLRVERVAPQLFSARETASKGALLWRERLSWLEPRPVSGPALLTLRFRGMDEDMVFQRSPVSGRYRQQTGSNRGDGLLGLALAADDLMVSSAKVEWLDVASLRGIRKLLVPVFTNKRLNLQAGEEGCVEVQVPFAKESTTIAVWASNLVFAPRDVAEIEITSGDPFSLAGKMRLFIDTETMLPIMKIVYDRTGQQERVVLGSIIGLQVSKGAPSTAGTEKTADNPGAMAYNGVGPILTYGSRGRSTVLYPQFVMICDRYSASLSEQLFDLRSVLVPKSEAAKAGGEDPARQRVSQDTSADEVVDER